MARGRFRNSVHVIFCCGRCGKPFADTTSAMGRLRAYTLGWRKVKRQFMCPSCLTVTERCSNTHSSGRSKSAFQRYLNMHPQEYPKELQNEWRRHTYNAGFGTYLYAQNKPLFDQMYETWCKEQLC